MGAMFEGPMLTPDVAQDAVIAALDGTEDSGATAGATAGAASAVCLVGRLFASAPRVTLDVNASPRQQHRHRAEALEQPRTCLRLQPPLSVCARRGAHPLHDRPRD